MLGESVEGQTYFCLNVRNSSCIGWLINPIEYPTVKSYDSPYKEKLDKSRLRVVHLYRKRHESEPGDIDNPCMTITDHSGELSGQNPIRMQGISHIFDVACTWLKSLLKNEEEPPVLEEIWSFQGSRDMDEARRSICGLEPLVSTTNLGLVPKWVQVHVGKPLSPYLVNRSLFNSDMGSLRGEVECLDAQRVREADFFEVKVQSDCCLDGSGHLVKSKLWHLLC